jgi:PelA/Pel-15E family pectate lyase
MNRSLLNVTKDPERTVMQNLERIRVYFGLLIALFAAVQTPTATGAIRWGQSALRQDPDWYASAEARAAADTVLLYQSPHGAWPKNTDLFKSVPADTLVRIHAGKEANTIDNGATTTPMRFLAKVIQATSEKTYKESFVRGLDYLLEAQYPNGGWPQFYPLRKGYYSHITFNDNTMVNALELLRDVARGQVPYDFVDDHLRSKAAAALERGIGCILKTQIKQDGKLTAWCAQHDEKTLEPAWARAYEPPSLSGAESVGIVRLLMSIEEPTPEIVAAIEGAVTWLRSVAMKGVRIETIRGDDGRRERRLVPDPAAPPLWARFYELGTNRPLYLDRDSVFRYDFAEIGYERRSGYAYHGTWAAELLTRTMSEDPTEFTGSGEVLK